MINMPSSRARHASQNADSSASPTLVVVVDMAILALSTMHPRFRGGMAVTTQSLLDQWSHDSRLTWVPWVPHALLPYFLMSTASDDTLRPPSPLDVMTAIGRWWWQDVLHGRRPSHRDIAFKALTTGTLTAESLERIERVVWYSPGFPLPKPQRAASAGSLPAVMTVHDVAPLLTPQSGWTPRHRMNATLNSVTAEDTIICPSRATQHALESITKQRVPRAIHIQPWGVGPQFQPSSYQPADITVQDQTFQADGYVLAVVGGCEPRKQVPLLVQTYERWARSATLKTIPPLVIVGAGGPLLKQRYGPWDHVTVVGMVDDETLVTLYQNALALICASADEGFGLPVLEAMACGCPVITTAGGSLPEVVGDAAVMIEANRPETWASAWEPVIQDADQRAAMRKAGVERAQAFSWERCAQAYADVLVATSVPFCPDE